MCHQDGFLTRVLCCIVCSSSHQSGLTEIPKNPIIFSYILNLLFLSKLATLLSQGQSTRTLLLLDSLLETLQCGFWNAVCLIVRYMGFWVHPRSFSHPSSTTKSYRAVSKSHNFYQPWFSNPNKKGGEQSIRLSGDHTPSSYSVRLATINNTNKPSGILRRGEFTAGSEV